MIVIAGIETTPITY